MPQFLLMGLGAAGLYAGYRLIKREGRRVAQRLREAEAELRRERSEAARKDVPTLVRDPNNGVFRPE